MHLRLILLSALLVVSLTACGLPQALPYGDGRELSAPVSDSGDALSSLFSKGFSSYGKSVLEVEQGEAYLETYESFSQAALSMASTAAASSLLPEETEWIAGCFRRDFPFAFWLKGNGCAGYLLNEQNAVSQISLSYTDTQEAALSQAAEILDSADKLLENIDPSLSDFDKALILYDRLVSHTAYDLNASRQYDLYGALAEGRATCEGYAKAYQYLLCCAGIEALIVYGDTDEPHAWNIVRLDGEYYHADPTWGSVSLKDGTQYLTHEYLFLTDDVIRKTHTPYPSADPAAAGSLKGQWNYPLPVCTSERQNYFSQTQTLLQAYSDDAFAAAIQNALDLAAASCSPAVQIRFADSSLAGEYRRLLLDTGDGDRLVQKKAAARGWTAVGRSYSNQTNTLTYLIDYGE